MSGFNEHDIAAYQGKEIEVYVWDASVDQYGDFSTKNQLRGAQNFNTTEERSETRVSELGYDATKVVYGSASYSVSITLIVRDLVQIARISGLEPTSAKRLIVTEFEPINAVCWFKDPDTGNVNMSKYAGGFKARTSSVPMAVDSNATITIEGGADLIASFDGKVEVIQCVGDGITTEFFIPSTDPTSADDVVLVESPAGVINDLYTFDASSTITPTYPSVIFTTAPANNDVIRIVYKVA